MGRAMSFNTICPLGGFYSGLKYFWVSGAWLRGSFFIFYCWTICALNFRAGLPWGKTQGIFFKFALKVNFLELGVFPGFSFWFWGGPWFFPVFLGPKNYFPKYFFIWNNICCRFFFFQVGIFNFFSFECFLGKTPLCIIPSKGGRLFSMGRW